MTNFIHITSPLDQFEIRDLLSLHAPIFGNFSLSITNIALYLTIAGSLVLILNLLSNNNEKIISNSWSIGLFTRTNLTNLGLILFTGLVVFITRLPSSVLCNIMGFPYLLPILAGLAAILAVIMKNSYVGKVSSIRQLGFVFIISSVISGTLLYLSFWFGFSFDSSGSAALQVMTISYPLLNGSRLEVELPNSIKGWKAIFYAFPTLIRDLIRDFIKDKLFASATLGDLGGSDIPKPRIGLMTLQADSNNSHASASSSSGSNNPQASASNFAAEQNLSDNMHGTLREMVSSVHQLRWMKLRYNLHFLLSKEGILIVDVPRLMPDNLNREINHRVVDLDTTYSKAEERYNALLRIDGMRYENRVSSAFRNSHRNVTNHYKSMIEQQ